MKRKAQGAIEYLFMIAAALVIILIVVRQLRNKGKSAGSQADISAKQSKVISLVQQYNNSKVWQAIGQNYEDCVNKGTHCDDVIKWFQDNHYNVTSS